MAKFNKLYFKNVTTYTENGEVRLSLTLTKFGYIINVIKVAYILIIEEIKRK